MGSRGKTRLRSPRAADDSSSPLLSPRQNRRDEAGHLSKERSASSPPFRVLPGNCETESQSSTDENLDHFTYEEECAKLEDCKYAESSSDVQYTKKPSEKPLSSRPSRHIADAASTNTMLALLGIFLAIPALLFLAHLVTEENKTSPVTSKPLSDIEDDIIRDLDKLRSETKQQMSFWKSLYSGLTTVTESSPRMPLVLLLAVPLDASQTAVCLAHHLTDIVIQAFEDTSVVKHDTISHLQMPWDDHKLALDSRLQNLSRTHAAIIYNLEKMPPKTATLLHGYFDNDNAPHKRAVIVVLLELELHYSSVSEAHLDLTVERRLHELWRQDLDPDDIPGLISRVAVQPLLVKPESKFVLQKLCPL